MTWNYRIVRHVNPSGEEWYAIHEVYYEETKVVTVTEEPICPRCETFEDLREAYELIRHAFDLPPIDYQDV
jgi:hypothetical protein